MRGREPWFADLRVRVEECYAAPMLSRAEALALLDIADAASNLIDRTIIDLVEVGRREMRLSQLLNHGPRATHSQERPG